MKRGFVRVKKRSNAMAAGARSILACLGLLFLVACAHAPGYRSPLLGTWVGESQNAAGSAFEFRADGTATWRLDQPFDIRYRVDDPLAPAHLDLFGFQTGPLKERTLYCLIDLVDDRLRMDCEPSERPGSLNPEQTQVFIRKPSGA
jgi:hypothetical protein